MRLLRKGVIMRLEKLRVKNYRSIADTGEVVIEPLQAFVGENNAGKSNLLRAIQCFLTPGAGGLAVTDVPDQEQETVIECVFGGLSDAERARLKVYLLGDQVILRKELRIENDEDKGKQVIKSEYHGYRAEPSNPYFSIAKILAEHGDRPKWADIAEAAGLTEYVTNAEGKVNKASYQAGLEAFLAENDVEYDEPQLGETQALGIPQNLLAALPDFYLLPAITDYSDEIDRRSTSTVFRRLMAELADRIMKADPRYEELETALSTVRNLLNPAEGEGGAERLAALGVVEDALREVICKMMPTVQSVRLGVEVEQTKDLFSKGVNIKIDDGVLTDVIDKGHGMQRSLVFSLLQMLIQSKREAAEADAKPIILAIEEPELYIHPHSQRLIFQVLKDFAGVVSEQPQGSDQVIYSTHSPAFVEVWNFERIGVVRKRTHAEGTKVQQAAAGVFGDPEDRKTFNTLTSFGLKHNEVFFARDAVIVEGANDEIAVIATARKLGRIRELPDEIGLSIIVVDGKGDIPKFQRVLNAFGMSYGVLLEQDGKPDDHPPNAAILAELNGNRLSRFPETLEVLCAVGQHFDGQRQCMQFFSDPANINADLEQTVANLLPE